jgi:hypothetical protein
VTPAMYCLRLRRYVARLLLSSTSSGSNFLQQNASWLTNSSFGYQSMYCTLVANSALQAAYDRNTHPLRSSDVLSVNSDVYQLDLPYPSAYDPKLALYCLKPFNHLIELGLVWFQTYPDDNKVTVHFDADTDNKKVRIYRDDDRYRYEGRVIRRPDAQPDPGFADDQGIPRPVIKQWQSQWPDPVVFDLHRLVLVPWERHQREKATQRKQKVRKRQEKGSSKRAAAVVKQKEEVENPESEHEEAGEEEGSEVEGGKECERDC